jgi:hypothetical protein
MILGKAIAAIISAIRESVNPPLGRARGIDFTDEFDE